MQTTDHTFTFEEMLKRAYLPTEWLIDGIYAKGEAVLFTAPSGSGKTYVVIDQLMAVAYGEPWLGHYPTTQGSVLYIPSEGRIGIAKRMLAAAQYRYTDRQDLPPFHTFKERLDLTPSGIDTQRALAAVMEEIQPVFVVVDVLRDTLAGVDENSAAFGDGFGRLRDMAEVYGATVLVCHHTGKDVSKGSRGHSSLRDKADVEIIASGSPVMGGSDIIATAVHINNMPPIGKNRNHDYYELTVDLRKPEGYDAPVLVGFWAGDGPSTTNLGGLAVAQALKTLATTTNQAPTSTGWRLAEIAAAMEITKQAAKKQADMAVETGLLTIDTSEMSHLYTLTKRGAAVSVNQPPTTKKALDQLSTNPQHPIGAGGVEGAVSGSAIQRIKTDIEQMQADNGDPQTAPEGWGSWTMPTLQDLLDAKIEMPK